MDDDSRVRRSIRLKENKDLKDNDKDLDEEEEELKRFFTESSGGSSDGTTTTRKEMKERRREGYDQIMNTLNVRRFMQEYFTYDANTPEEQEYLNMCRHNTYRNIYMYSILSTSVLSVNSIYFYRILPRWFHLVSLVSGVGIGSIFGILQSTKYTMKTLYSLGGEYTLGSMCIDEVESFSIDQSRNSNERTDV